MSANRNVLVIVGSAVASAQLVGALIPRAGGSAGAEGVVGFTLLVPAVPCSKESLYDSKEQGWEIDWADAALRAERATEAVRAAGLEVIESIVGDADFAAAAGDVLHSREIDDVVVLVDPDVALGASPDLVAV
jgi:hypothetical protein